MAGIDSIVNTRADAFTNNPQALMQRYAMGQDLLDLLALQKLKQDKEAAARSLQMGMQVPQGTIKDQLQGQVMDMTKREVVQAVAPGLQQQGQRMQAEQVQNMMGAGLPTQPAPALQGMAQGGIVGYAPGGRIRDVQSSVAKKNLAEKLEGILQALDPTIDPLEDVAIQRTRLPNFGGLPPVGILEGALPRPEDYPRYISDAENEANVRMGLDEGGPRTSFRRSPLSEENYSLAAAPAPQAPTPATTQPSGIAATQAPSSKYDELLTKLLESMSAESTPAAAQPVERPQFRSRYEDRLAEIEAEKQDRMGALIEFLQAAGASGGTNLGATLMGGGSGLRAREERLRQQEADTLKSIIEDENTQAQREFNELQLTQQSENARLDRESRNKATAVNLLAQMNMSAQEIASRLGMTEYEVNARIAEAAADRASKEQISRDELAFARERLDAETTAAVARAEAEAGANLSEAQREAYATAVEAMKNDEGLRIRLMDIQRRYKDNPAEMALQTEIETDTALENHMARLGHTLSGSNIGGMKTPAPTN
jgi:hypothetical protein